MNEQKHRFGFLNAQFWAVGEENGAKVVRTISKYPFMSGIVFPTKIYHYTSAESLISIVRDRGFFLSHYAYMNDAVEFTHGLGIAIKTVENLSKKIRYRKMKGVLTRILNQLSSADLPDYYIACFTKEADSLEQWRAYCPSGGVNIEISGHGGNLGVGPRMLFRPVIYEDADKIRFMVLLIRRYFSEILKDIEFYDGVLPTSHQDEYIRLLSYEIWHSLPTFKHAAFRSENEIRLVISNEEQQYFCAIHNRARNGKIIPYLKTNEWSEKLPPPSNLAEQVPPLSISSIIIGPQPDRELVAKSILSFMRSNGYPDIKVHFSSVPYRTQ